MPPSAATCVGSQSRLLMLSRLGFFIYFGARCFIFSIPCCYNCKEVVEDDKRDEHIYEFGRSPKTAPDCDLLHVF